MGDAETVRTKKEKSKKYPRFNLETCAEFIRMLRTKFGKSNIDINTVYDALNTRKSSTFMGKLSSAKQFGLIDITNHAINFSEVAEDILMPLPDRPIEIALSKAFQSPPLYAELIQRFDGSELPEMFPNILSRNYGIANAVKEEAAKIFIESAQYAKVLDDTFTLKVAGNIDGYKQPLSETKDESEETTSESTPIIKAVLPKISSSMQKIEITLSSGENALIYVPKKITLEDIEVLKLQMEVLKFQAMHFHTKEEITE